VNPKFRELAEQAKMSTYLLAYGLEFNMSIERFAQLIVQECAKVGDSGDPLQDGEITRMIKQHFEVAE